MTAPLLYALSGSEHLAASLREALGAEAGDIETRRFPDGESYVRLLSSPEGRAVVLLAALDRPDDRTLPLMFAAKAARNLGARSVGLICPYLPYMRQDRRFKPGEAVTSATYAEILSAALDWLVTVDPHLHRRADLSEIYTLRGTAVHAAPLIARWIRQSVENPLLIGPDAESVQWVRAVADRESLPYVVLEKIRRGDRDVEVSVPDVDRWRDHTPVLVDDIVSTARTMIETVGHLANAGMRPPVCIAVHGIFAGGAFEALQESGAARIVTCNTVAHESNAIDVTPLLADAAREALSAT